MYSSDTVITDITSTQNLLLIVPTQSLEDTTDQGSVVEQSTTNTERPSLTTK